MYVPTFGLSPPTTTLTISAAWASRTTPRRLHRSARMPDGTSSSGTTAAYAAAIRATLPLSKPMSVMNSFSIGTHSATFCRNAAT